MKKLAMVLMALTMALTASAQFEQGKKYAAASLSGLDLSYNGAKELSFDVAAKGGYLIQDNWMLLGKVGYEHYKGFNALQLGVGGRYYIIQNGIYLGVNADYRHAEGYNDFVPGVEVGYAFFISRTCTIEPAIYYDQSFKDHSNYSTIGLRIGFGIYL